MSRRVLITGVSRMWGAALAARLEAHPDVEEIVAVDARGPARELARTEFIRADIRHSLVGKLIRAMEIDTVVHAGLILDTRHVSRRQVHEQNVIGTMNLLAACSGDDSPVSTVVVKSSTAIYGCAPDAPSFWSEVMPRRRPRDSFSRDLEEVESYVRDFAARQPNTTVTTLRFADVLGSSDETPFGAYFDLPAVPTVLGFDPRLQFVHEDDVVDALEHAIHCRYAGIVNVAGDGIVILSHAIGMTGKINLPIIPFTGSQLMVAGLRALHAMPLPDHLLPLLQHGRVVDTTRLKEEFGFTPKHSSVDCVMAHATWARTHDITDEPYAYEADLEAFLRSRAAAPGNGAHNGNGHKVRSGQHS